MIRLFISVVVDSFKPSFNGRHKHKHKLKFKHKGWFLVGHKHKHKYKRENKRRKHKDIRTRKRPCAYVDPVLTGQSCIMAGVLTWLCVCLCLCLCPSENQLLCQVKTGPT